MQKCTLNQQLEGKIRAENKLKSDVTCLLEYDPCRQDFHPRGQIK